MARSSKQVSLKHHYLPEFYTRRWVGAKNVLCEFSRPYAANNVIRPRRVHPADTGHERGLYALTGVPPEKAQIMEDGFFKQLDTLASRALDLIEAGDMLATNPPMRSAWSRFILSLLLRAPNDLRLFRESYLIELMNGIDELDAKWAKIKRPEDPQTLREAFATFDPDIAYRHATLMLRQLIDHEKICGVINNMRWFVVETADTGVELLTSDRPVVAPESFLSPNGWIVIPIGPTRIFVATKTAELGLQLWDADRNEFARCLNEQVVGQAEKYAYGRDDSQLDFVRRHMFTTPRTSIFAQLAQFRAQRRARLSEQAVSSGRNRRTSNLPPGP